MKKSETNKGDLAMTTENNNLKKMQSAPPKGEIWVWFTSLGLLTGLIMVVALFGLIAVRGFAFFWPVPVAQFEVKEGSGSALRGIHEFAGAIISTTEQLERDVGTVEEGREELVPQSTEEYRVFIGNRDQYGLSYRYFPVKDVTNLKYPKDIVRAERRIEGDAFFYPLELTLEDGQKIEYTDPQFRRELTKVVNEARERRSKIGHIDRRQIGPINLEIRSIDLDVSYINRQKRQQGGTLTEGQISQLEEYESRRKVLNEQFEKLRVRADELRLINEQIVLRYRTADGTEGSISMVDLFRFYYPNELGFAGKIRIFAIQFWDFVSGYPREANMSGGIFPAIFGTFVMTLIMSIAVTPFGVITAVYLREYARQGPLVRSVRIAINNLAGVPSIVFGVFGLGFFVYLMGGTIDSLFFSKAEAVGTPTFGTGGILWAGLTLALLNLPVVIVATEEAITSVTRGVREGSLACGASKWQTIQRLVIPASMPGILTGMILSMARGAGEVAPLMLVGVVALAPNLPIDGNFPFIHLERKFMHLGFHIYDVGFQSPDSEAAIPTVFATTLVLIALIILLNLSAIILRNRIRKRHISSAF